MNALAVHRPPEQSYSTDNSDNSGPVQPHFLATCDQMNARLSAISSADSRVVPHPMHGIPAYATTQPSSPSKKFSMRITCRATGIIGFIKSPVDNWHSGQ